MSGSFFGELKRRNVLRAGLLYIGVIWALSQGAAQLLPVFDVPNWVVRAFVIAGVIGFPFWLLFAWLYELTPEGIKRDSDVAIDATTARRSGRKLDIAIVAVLVIAVVLLLADRFANHPASEDKSVAVLPFTDLSPAKDQEYFSDGMSEELLNALAKVKDLKVAGRTSSFSFKGKNQDMRTIGTALGVANVVEGSVRKQGDKVRITAQLIKASNGFHLWSETYDGDLKDVFELQERIARSITEALKVVLVGVQQQRIVPVATSNPDAYALYLKATVVFNHRDGPHFAGAIDDLHEALRLDPSFARAHARLAALYALATNYTTIPGDEAFDATRREAALATQLDPTLAEPYAALGVAYTLHRRHVLARMTLERAIALDADDPSTNLWLALEKASTGYTKEATVGLDRTLAIDPLMPNALFNRAFQYLSDGDRARAKSMWEQAVKSGHSFGDMFLALMMHDEGRDAEAVETFVRGARSGLAGLPDDTLIALAKGLFGDSAAHDAAVRAIAAYMAGHPATVSAGATWGMVMLGEPATALANAAPAPTSNDTLLLVTTWSPYGAAARKLPQFGKFTVDLGLTELWDQFGAPDLCKRRAPGDYVCE